MTKPYFFLILPIVFGAACTEYSFTANGQCVADTDCPEGYLCGADAACRVDADGRTWVELDEAVSAEGCTTDDECPDGSICEEDSCTPGKRCADGRMLDDIELCDQADNDCDGEVDEDFGVGGSCSVGVGECARAGALQCDPHLLGVRCSVEPASPGPERCDGLDNDCDGGVDEDFVELAARCTAGEGACFTAGSTVCSADGLTTVCSVSALPAGVETCGNSLDDDCDGEVDEGFFDVGQPCSSGLGQCAVAGSIVCDGTGLATTCDAVAAAPTMETCDGLDNDCDGQIDGILEACSSDCGNGNRMCVTGGWTECSARKPAPTDDCGDYFDDDCDGEIDNGCMSVPHYIVP